MGVSRSWRAESSLEAFEERLEPSERLVGPRPLLTQAVERDAVTAIPGEDRLHIADPELRKVTGQAYGKGLEVSNYSSLSSSWSFPSPLLKRLIKACRT